MEARRPINISSSVEDSIKKERQQMWDALFVSIAILMPSWILFLMNHYLGFHLDAYGLQPRTVEGLIGLISMHFLHGSWEHLLNNSSGFIVLNSFLFYFYRKISIPIFLYIFFFSGIMLWFVGRPSNHIGLSMVVYGEFAFLLISGLIRNNPLLMRVALVVTFFYGSIVWYVLPIDQKISWEGHLCGALVGVVLAIIYKKKGPKRKLYQYEMEPEMTDEAWQELQERLSHPPRHHEG
jgi:membrane associated rhomboid family serine protease